MPYRATLSRDFPGAVTYERYLARVSRAVLPLGFDREHSFAAVSVCRDELAQPLLQAVTRRWDQPFNLGASERSPHSVAPARAPRCPTSPTTHAAT